MEAAAATLAKLFPWGGDFDVSARQFNQQMCRRYERALAFIKAHYCTSDRRDSPFWRDNVKTGSIPRSFRICSPDGDIDRPAKSIST